MSAGALLEFLRGRGLVIWIQDGQLMARTRDGSPVPDQDAASIRSHAPELGRHLRALATSSPVRSGPDGKPSLVALAARYRTLFGDSCEDAYHEVTGVDLAVATPGWPDLHAFDAWLRRHEGKATSPAPASLDARQAAARAAGLDLSSPDEVLATWSVRTLGMGRFAPRTPQEDVLVRDVIAARWPAILQATPVTWEEAERCAQALDRPKSNEEIEERAKEGGRR
jgi:hypothetical protein